MANLLEDYDNNMVDEETNNTMKEIDKLETMDIIKKINKLEKKDYNKKYYEENKDKIKEGYKAKSNCLLCNRLVCKNSMNKHLKSKLCLKSQELNKKIIEFKKEKN